MSETTDTPETPLPPADAAGDAAPGATTGPTSASTTAGDTGTASASADAASDAAGETPVLDALRAKVTETATEFLKNRLGLEDVAGALKLPDIPAFENVGQRAEQFIRGFFRGFVDKSPEEREVEAGTRAPDDVPNATEIMGRLLAKASDSVSTTFHTYLQDNVVGHDATQKDPVVVDGRFVFRHGAPLLASFVQALGAQFASTPSPLDPDAVGPAATRPEAAGPKPHVDYKVDVPAIFKSLFVRPTEPAAPEADVSGPPVEPAPRPAETAPKQPETANSDEGEPA
ncbi:MAG: hypothetical protein JNJ59_04060 [Deltaproteobacteria bacterium]|jgi:hypothetical protein|nr:hypothetical protein [Deltaproteobacteria bacterium]